ncbi:MAG: ABC transporter permease [Propionivibrio sp.]
MKSNWFAFFGRFSPLIFLALLMAVFTVLEPRFLTSLNLFNVLRQISIYGIIAVGMTYVILIGGIDLSVGSLLGLAGIIGAVVAKGGFVNGFDTDAAALAGNPWWLAAIVAILLGGFGGFLQGAAITRLRVPAFVVTLGGMSIFRGLTLIAGNGGPISGFGEAFTGWGQGQIGPVPIPLIIFIAVAIVGHIVLRHTAFGRSIYAIGGNADGARLCGLDVGHVTRVAYVIVGLCAGLGGFLLTARLDSAEAVAGAQYELSIIAAVVIGGTSLFGGVGTIAGTVIGTILVGILLNGLVILNVSSYIQQVIIGGVIVFAVAFDTYAKSRVRS